MSATAVSRTFLRRPNLPAVARHPVMRRSASSTTEKASEAASNATAKAKSTAANIQSKASEGLSRVTSSAGPAITGATKAVGKRLGAMGGRTGRIIGSIEAAIPPTIYYSKVGLELSKLVFRGQKMSPPSLQTFQTYFSPLLNAFRSPQALARSASSATADLPEQTVGRLRGLSGGQLVAGAVIFAEVLGFFTVGEIIGRMKLVGYRGDVHHEH